MNYYLILNFILVSAELKMDVLREREEKENLERQLLEEQKIRGEFLNVYYFYANEHFSIYKTLLIKVKS